jgi:CheY-like chemotaxis protein
MVVEDEPDVYDMVLAMYETLGIDGVAFTTGEEAIDWIEEVETAGRAAELPELALLDIRLPGEVSGPLVGARLRQSKVLGGIGIVLMTAYKLSAQDERAAVEQSGADLLLYKPLPELRSFGDLMRQTLKRSTNRARIRG